MIFIEIQSFGRADANYDKILIKNRKYLTWINFRDFANFWKINPREKFRNVNVLC